MLARRLDLTPTDARIAVTAGIGSGIGAIFRAPLGGAVLGAEILYRSDLEAEALFPSFIASVTGFSVFAAFQGFAPIFGYLQPGHFDRLQQLPFYAVIGLVAGVVRPASTPGCSMPRSPALAGWPSRHGSSRPWRA